MKMKTLDSQVKTAFTNAGCTLTPQQEHIAASATSINWLQLLQTLGSLASKILPIIIGLLGGNTPPTPPAKAGANYCDHHKCCCEALEAELCAVEILSRHICDCCCE